jgi:hypothetical protein
MLDDELREQLAAWARPLEFVAPPDVSVIRRRARRRTIRRAVSGAGVAAGAAALIVIGGLALAGHFNPGTAPVPYVSPLPALAEAPYYLTIEAQGSSAVVHRTASGAVAGAIAPQRGTRFISVAATRDDRRFALAADTGSGTRFYSMDLGPAGRPGPLEPISAPTLAERSGGCPVRLAGLALSPDGRTLAVSTLSDCASGGAGPSEIDVVSLPSGSVLSTFRPGNGYPLSLSWTGGGALAYDWTGPQPGVWLIRSAASPGSRPHLLIRGSAGLGGYTGAQNPLITPDGSAVIATLGRGTALEVAEFSVRTGRVLRVLIPAVANAAQYCGPLWTDSSGQHLLAACGDGAESSIDDGNLTRLPSRWQLPFYATPGGPQIAW